MAMPNLGTEIAGSEGSILTPPTSSTPSSSSRTVDKHVCSKCGKHYHSKQGLTDHEKREHGTPSYICSHGDCDKKCISKTLYRAHSLQHIQEKGYHCGDCSAKFTHKKDLVAHIKAKHTSTHFKCQTCQREFPYERNLRRHVDVEHRCKRFICTTCALPFKYKCNMRRHQR